MDIKGLVEDFRTRNLSNLKVYENLISTKDYSGIFLPYIPFVGRLYDQHRILIYAKAQNIRQKDSYFENLRTLNDEQQVKRLYNARNYREIAIAPYSSGILPALAGIFLYVRFGMVIQDFDEIQQHIAVTNYYKFSLNKGNKDINPEKLEDFDLHKYWEVNDALCDRELECLTPNTIISFRGRHNVYLRKKGHQPHIIADPSFILQGGYGKFREGGCYHDASSKVSDRKAIELAELYSQKCEGRYKEKKKLPSIKIYLLKYYHDWKV